MRILILCTGNSVRSQMAEGFLRSIDPALEVESAGTSPAGSVHPAAVRVMQEVGIDISHSRSKSVDQFLREPFDYVITVCDHAKEACPAFSGAVRHRLHMGFDDPSAFWGTHAKILTEFRRVRDEIGTAFQQFYSSRLNRPSRATA